jgi:hypothetical protein
MSLRIRDNADTILSVYQDYPQVLMNVIVGVRALVRKDSADYIEKIMKIGELSHDIMDCHLRLSLNNKAAPERLDVTRYVKDLFAVVGAEPEVVLEVNRLPADLEAVEKSFRSLAIKAGLTISIELISGARAHG